MDKGTTAEEFYDMGSIDGYVAVFEFDISFESMDEYLRSFMDSQLPRDKFQVDRLNGMKYGIVMMASEPVAADIANLFVFYKIPEKYGPIAFDVGFAPVDNIANVARAYKEAYSNRIKFSLMTQSSAA